MSRPFVAHEPIRNGHNWHGGRQSSHGYVRLCVPNHPRASANGTVYEHILIAEKAMGKYLPSKAQVHHWDGDGQNNTRSNLVVCQDLSYHRLLHRRTRAKAMCGNPNALRCRLCKKYDDPSRMIVTRWRRGTGYRLVATHSPCPKKASYIDG